MKVYLDTEHYGEIDLENMEFVVKKFKGDKAISMAPMNKNWTLEELKDFIKMQKRFLKN